jgi:hypothetical protein
MLCEDTAIGRIRLGLKVGVSKRCAAGKAA